jgi:hypothetical protein
MPTSPDTLLRRVKGAPYDPTLPPRYVGVDDWAIRKGQHYGTRSHFLCAAIVTTGPGNDSSQLRPAIAQASLRVSWDRLLADAAFDSEENHRRCREDLGVRSTIIPLNRRRSGRKWPKTRYRRQMKKRFHKRVYR